MNTNPVNKIRKPIGFQPLLEELINIKAAKFGMSFSEYIRFIMWADVQDELGKIQTAPNSLNSQITQAINNFKKGNTKKLNTKNQEIIYDQLAK